MKKIKNTATNKILFLIGFLALMGFIGYKLGRAEDKKVFTIGGIILGLMIFTGVSSWVFEPKSESSYDPSLLIPGGGASKRTLRIVNI